VVVNTSNPTAVANRRYVVQIVICMVAYIAVLFPAVWLLNRGLEGPLKFVVAVAPIVPVAFVFLAVLRYFAATDEFERRVMVESLAVAGGITALLAVTYGFLQNAGLPYLSAWWTWTVFMASWLIARLLVSRHYDV
jgi:O-antigen/teichoic acid export membrane protein